MKPNPFILKSLLIVGVPLAGATIVLPKFNYAREKARHSGCQGALKQLGFGFAQYARDYDGYLPLVKGSDHPTNPVSGKPPFGWADAIQPYVGGYSQFQCPSDPYPAGMQIIKGTYTDYWMNARLSGRKRDNRASNLILLGDGIGDKRATARYSLSVLPTQTPTCDGNNCQSAWKHLGGANFLFVDGDVKWLLPSQVSIRKGASATFRP